MRKTFIQTTFFLKWKINKTKDNSANYFLKKRGSQNRVRKMIESGPHISVTNNVKLISKMYINSDLQN